MNIYSVHLYYQISFYKSWNDNHSKSGYVRKYLKVKSSKNLEDFSKMIHDLKKPSYLNVRVEGFCNAKCGGLSEEKACQIIKSAHLEIVPLANEPEVLTYSIVKNIADMPYVINSKGDIVIQPETFKSIYLDENLAILRKFDNTWGVIDLNSNDMIIPFGKYSWIDYNTGFKHGVIRVIAFGTPNTEENFKAIGLPYLPEDMSVVELVSQSGCWGLVDKTGKEVLPCKYDRLVNIEDNNGIVTAQCDFKFKYVNRDGEIKDGSEFSNKIEVFHVENKIE